MARFQHFKYICTWIDKYAYVYSGRKSHASSIDRAKRKRHLLTILLMAVFRKCGTCATNADTYRGLMEAIITKDIQQRFKIRNTDALRKKASMYAPQ